MNALAYQNEKYFLLRLPLLRHVIVRRLLDDVCDSYIERTDGISDRFGKRFFLQAIHCARADVYELYAAILRADSAALLMMERPAPQALAVYIKRFCLYHVIEVCAAGGRLSDADATRCASDVLQLTDAERDAATHFVTIGHEDLTMFRVTYAQMLAAELTKMSDVRPIVLAFMSQFLYRSHEGFIKSFTNYMPLGGGRFGDTIHR